MYRVLAALAEQARPLRLIELSALTSADQSSMSRIVGDMYMTGLVSPRVGCIEVKIESGEID